jgi:uncharacterized membrane protein YeaQ/YmgE (transglycosylase-associated protein family)
VIRFTWNCSEQLVEPGLLREGKYMGIISWIILGLIAGFIGSKIVDRQGQGFWLDIALGIVGALAGGFLFDLEALTTQVARLASQKPVFMRARRRD